MVDPDRLHESRNTLRRALAAALKEDFSRTLQAMLHSTGPYSPDARSMGKRALRNLSLGYLAELGLTSLAYEQFRKADNMTDAMAALSTLANFDCPERQRALDAFYEKWKDEPLVVDKWLAVQAGSRLPHYAARGQGSCCSTRRSTSRCRTRCTR